MLSSFEIKEFRTFSHLRVERLGRVNLIVGRNNVGKTMFLEALRLHATGGSPNTLRNLLLDRDEVITEAPPEAEESEYQLRVASLFHRRLLEKNGLGEISLGPIGKPLRTVKIMARMLRRVRHETGGFSFEVVEKQDEVKDEPNLAPGLVVSTANSRTNLPFSFINARSRVHRLEPTVWPAFVPARGASDREIARWWDAVALQDAEQRVIECLRIISAVDRINLVEHPARPRERLVMARISGDPSPVPLKSLGDGMARMFQIALALECSRVGALGREVAESPALFPELYSAESRQQPILLVDEVENGIHYTVLSQLWRFILRLAELHDVQVFATSHSWDCIRGLQEASADTSDADVMLIRLERGPKMTKAVLFDRKELSVVTRDAIEVR